MSTKDDGQTEVVYEVTLAEVHAYLLRNQQMGFLVNHCNRCPVAMCLKEKYGKLFDTTTYESYSPYGNVHHTNEIIAFILRHDAFSLSRYGRQILVREGVIKDG